MDLRLFINRTGCAMAILALSAACGSEPVSSSSDPVIHPSCGSSESEDAEETESSTTMLPPWEEIGEGRLYYIGSCSWLQCVLGSNSGSCGLGCSDSSKRIARADWAGWNWWEDCGATLRVCRKDNGHCTTAKYWTNSNTYSWEGNDALLNALGIGHYDGWCTDQSNWGSGGDDEIEVTVYER